MDLGGSVDSARNDTRLKGEGCQTRPSYDAFSTAADVRKERADAVNDSHEVHVEHPSALCSSASALARVERRDLGVAFKSSRQRRRQATFLLQGFCERGPHGPF